jgi:hypothetical protein
LGIVKENHGELREALKVAIEIEKSKAPPDVEEHDRGHGRLEIRKYWWVKAEEDMREYLEREFGWPDVRWYGEVRRERTLLFQGKCSSEEVIVIYESAEKVVRILKLWYDLPTLSLGGGSCNVERKLLSAIY